MPIHVLQKVSDALNDAGKPIRGSRLLLLGMAYKPDVHDTRESPSLEVMRQLLEPRRRGQLLRPLGRGDRARRDRCTAASSGRPSAVREADCVVVLTPHRQFLEQPLWEDASMIVDTRNVVPDGPNVTRI